MIDVHARGRTVGRAAAWGALALVVLAGWQIGAQASPAPASGSLAAPPTGPIALPQLSDGPQGRCDAVVAVQNVSARPARAVVVYWPGTGTPPVPTAVACTGLVTPGATWYLTAPADARSGLLYPLAEVGLGDVGSRGPDASADHLCDRLAADVVGSAERFAEFAAAWATGGTWSGVDLSLAAGPRLAATVRLEYASVAPPIGARLDASYAGVAVGSAAGAATAHAPYVSAASGYETHLIVQGISGRPVEVWLVPEGDCGAQRWGVAEPAPGASEVAIVGALAPPGFVGSAILRSAGAFAAVVEVRGPDTLATYAAATDSDAASELAGALVLDPSHGWEARLRVQNLSADSTADVRATFLDAGGSPVLVTGGALCPGSSRTFSLPRPAAASDSPFERTGSVRVAGGAGALLAAALEVAGTADDPGGDLVDVRSAVYALGPAAGSPVVAVPAAVVSADGSDAVADLAIANLASGQGWTDAAVLLYDQNALVDVICRRLPAGGSALVDLAATTSGGLRGGAVVSASWWSHAGQSGPALGAVATTRSATGLHGTADGDDLSAVAGIGLDALPWPADAPRPLACPHGAPPPSAPAATAPEVGAMVQLHLPLVTDPAPGAACSAARIEIVNAGSAAARAVVAEWGPSHGCPRGDFCYAPYVECTGLLAPGGRWSVDGLATTASASVFPVVARTVAEVGGSPGDTRAVADVLCEALGSGTAGCGTYAAFKRAYDAGLEFAGVPLAGARGPRLQAAVLRTCADPVRPGATRQARHDAVPADEVFAADPMRGGYRYGAATVGGGGANGGTIIHVQNAGTACTPVSLWLQPHMYCLRAREVPVGEIPPGEAMAIDLSALDPGFDGLAVVRGSEPLAVRAETSLAARLAPVPMWPGASPLDVDADGRVTEADGRAVAAAYGARPGDAKWRPRADLDANGAIEAMDNDRFWLNTCGRDDPPDPPDPPAAAARPATVTYLPSMGAPAWSDGCSATVAVQNVGGEPGGGVLLLWGEPGAESCVPPIASRCIGLIRPGASWFVDLESTVGARSGTAYSITARTMSEIGGTPPGPAYVLETMCTSLGRTVGNCTALARFAAAWESGASYEGVPLARAAGPPLVVTVRRTCGSPWGTSAASLYQGVGAHRLGVRDPAAGGWVVDVPAGVVDAREGTGSTVVHAQNAGRTQATIEWALRREGECGDWIACPTALVAPGARAALPVEVCARDEFRGSVRVTSSQPVAVVADVVRQSSLASVAGSPAVFGGDAAGAALVAPAGASLHGAYLLDPDDGWRTTVTVRSASPRRGRARVELRDPRGGPIYAREVETCRGGSARVRLPGRSVMGSLLDPRAGYVAARGLVPRGEPWDRHFGPMGSVLLEIVSHDDPQGTTAAAYELLPDLVAPADGARPARGVAVVALPDVELPQAAGQRTIIAIANVVERAGYTDVAVTFERPDGRAGVACRRIPGGTVATIDVSSVGLPPGFRGAAVVSASAWRHPDAAGPVGLVAALVRQDLRESVRDGLSVVAGEPLQDLPGPSGSVPADPCPGGFLAAPTATPRVVATPTPRSTAGTTVTPVRPTITPGGPTVTPDGSTATPGGATVTPGGPTETPGGAWRIFLPRSGRHDQAPSRPAR